MASYAYYGEGVAMGEMGVGGHGGWPRSRDLQTTNPNAPKNYLAALCEACPYIPNPCYINYEYCELGV